MGSQAFDQLTLGELLSSQARALPDHPYLRLDDEVWTYTRADQAARRLAAGLLDLGLAPGDRLAMILPNIPAYVLTLFAAAKVGLIPVPINVRRHPSEVHMRLSRTRPSGVVTFSDPNVYPDLDHLQLAMEIRDDLPGLDHVVAIGGTAPGVIPWDKLLDYPDILDQDDPKPRDPAIIIHTLGSSGNPRGAVLGHGSLIRNAAAVAESLQATNQDVFLGTVPFTNAFGLTPTILACTLSGAQLVCLPRFHVEKALDWIHRGQVTVFHGVPTMFSLLLNHPDFDPGKCASVRTGIMSGAPCPPELVKQVRKEMSCRLLLAYGVTEASPSVTITRLDDGPVTATETVGRPHAGVEIKVVDPVGEELPDGQQGELCVRGYNVMQGYWDDPEATAQVLDADGWLHTGDLAVRDPDGPVRIVGRLDDVINRSGFKIYPGTIEMVLRSHPAVRDAAVVGVPDLIYGELSYACVVRQAGFEIEAGNLQAFAAERLADYAVPDRVLFFDALPRRGSGPVRKDYLRERIRIRGRTWKFGRNIDTDAIIPARRCNTADPRELALYCMEDADPTFVSKMQRGDLIIADANFGCGSSREVAPLSIKAAGVSAVIARSFARIFFRNAINIGLPILECSAAVDGILEGDEVEVEPATGTIRNLTRGEIYQAEPFPDFLQRIIDRGGLLAYVEERLAQIEEAESP